MTSRAYPETYLSEVQLALGAAFDFAINTCHIPGQNFLQLFTESSVSKQIENGDPSCLLEKNGIEVAAEIILETSGRPVEIATLQHCGHSQEYWIGWTACYFQWFSAKSFNDIFDLLSFDDLQKIHHTLHTANRTKSLGRTDKSLKKYARDNKLKRMQTAFGYTQATLAKRARLSLRLLQMYALRNKSLDRASIEALYRLSKLLGCSIEDLLDI